MAVAVSAPFPVSASVVVSVSVSPFADDDYDLRLNGDFRGGNINAEVVPGWVAAAGDGSMKIIQGSDFDEFAAEISATAQVIFLQSEETKNFSNG